MAKLIYDNPLSDESKVKDLFSEGKMRLEFREDSLVMTGEDESDCSLWFPKIFPADIRIEWEFMPLAGNGAAAVSFATRDENAFNVMYYKRRDSRERAFHTCSLIKDAGSNVVAVGADPIPDAKNSFAGTQHEKSGEDNELSWYRMSIEKKDRDIRFFINDLQIISFHDDGMLYGGILTGGGVGIRQIGALSAGYRNFKVVWI
jgi:hypothetical protein